MQRQRRRWSCRRQGEIKFPIAVLSMQRLGAVQGCREEEEPSLDRSWLLALPLAKAGSIEATNLQQEE
jgi:hypothetical protein